MDTVLKTKVTEQGVLVPKRLLEGVDEVEIRKVQDALLILPVNRADPILELGKHPLDDPIDDSSTHNDR